MMELVAWDFNGTILADSQACTDAGNYIIKSFGGTPVPRKRYAATFDFPTTDFYRAQGCDMEALLAPESAYVQMFHGVYEARAAKCRTRRGAREVLGWLRDKDIDSVILSNHMQGAIRTQLQRLGIEGYFAEVLANTDLEATHTGKNKIDRMADYLSRTHHDPAGAAIVGDSPEDIGIGKALGMRTIAVADGYFSTPRLRASGPDYLVENLGELVGILECI
ncbi:MAG: HAD family hydrolase [Candidatus Aenigmarchaeota archaeon]|nr:HAD family hydrolase [Candidatus Aenigmarchaeota archaeon]